MKTGFQSVDEYIAAQPPGWREILSIVREAIRKAVPDAEEGISYQMPAYKLPQGAVIYFAAWKRHYSLYPVSADLTAACKPGDARYELNDKGTMRLPWDEPVPAGFIARIARLRAKQVRAADKR